MFDYFVEYTKKQGRAMGGGSMPPLCLDLGVRSVGKCKFIDYR